MFSFENEEIRILSFCILIQVSLKLGFFCSRNLILNLGAKIISTQMISSLLRIFSENSDIMRYTHGV